MSADEEVTVDMLQQKDNDDDDGYCHNHQIRVSH